MIGSGGSHITMPKWGEILTQDQIDALVRFTLESGDQTGIFAGGIVYSDNCTSCHGQFGQGGPESGQGRRYHSTYQFLGISENPE